MKTALVLIEWTESHLRLPRTSKQNNLCSFRTSESVA